MSSEVAAVTVVAMPAAQRPLLGRLLQLYLHDFSEYSGIGSRYGGVDEAGDGRRWSGPVHCFKVPETA